MAICCLIVFGTIRKLRPINWSPLCSVTRPRKFPIRGTDTAGLRRTYYTWSKDDLGAVFESLVYILAEEKGGLAPKTSKAIGPKRRVKLKKIIGEEPPDGFPSGRS